MSHTVCRMTGQPYHYSQALLPTAADEQIRTAMDFDDSLFATEEQNLFIDEVRETTRWRRVYETLQHSGGDSPSFRRLGQWAETGLRYLVGLAARKEDGPLGWTSDQHVFAVCARILLCAAAAAGSGGSAITGLLKEFVELGERGRIHGSLLEMARLPPSN